VGEEGGGIREVEKPGGLVTHGVAGTRIVVMEGVPVVALMEGLEV